MKTLFENKNTDRVWQTCPTTMEVGKANDVVLKILIERNC